MLKHTTILFCVSLCFGAPVFAGAIEDVIEGQLDAFASREIIEAWEFASPMIQKRFIDPRSFSQMVENGFAVIWDNADVRFGPREALEDGRVRQIVTVTGQNGITQSFEYDMTDVDGRWRINGVWPVDTPEASV